MSSRKGRIPGTAGPSFAVPLCSVHGTPCVRGADGAFVCPECMDEWLQKMSGQTAGGVELPTGVRDERILGFRQMLPNRLARRRVRRG